MEQARVEGPLGTGRHEGCVGDVQLGEGPSNIGDCLGRHGLDDRRLYGTPQGRHPFREGGGGK